MKGQKESAYQTATLRSGFVKITQSNGQRFENYRLSSVSKMPTTTILDFVKMPSIIVKNPQAGQKFTVFFYIKVAAFAILGCPQFVIFSEAVIPA